MGKTVVLLVYGEGDYGAMHFQKNFDVQEVYEEMVEEGVKKRIVIYDDENYGEEEIWCRILEFGEVDSKFITFMLDEFVDYDQQKAKDFYIVKSE